VERRRNPGACGKGEAVGKDWCEANSLKAAKVRAAGNEIGEISESMRSGLTKREKGSE